MERLLKKGHEVIYLTEPVDEYCIQALPEFDGKRFQNVAKEGVQFDESDKAKEKREALEKEFEPLPPGWKRSPWRTMYDYFQWLYCIAYYKLTDVLEVPDNLKQVCSRVMFRSRRLFCLRGWPSLPVLWLPVSMDGLATWNGSWKPRLTRQEKTFPQGTSSKLMCVHLQILVAITFCNCIGKTWQHLTTLWGFGHIGEFVKYC